MNVDLFLQTLPIMGKGLFGIFVVTGVIVLCINGLNKVTAPKKETITNEVE